MLAVSLRKGSFSGPGWRGQGRLLHRPTLMADCLSTSHRGIKKWAFNQFICFASMIHMCRVECIA